MNTIEPIFKEFKKTALSDEERVSMRRALRLFMAENPVRQSGWSVALVQIRNAFESIERISLQRHAPALAALVLVLAAGVGTSYAAENALPGDTLYPVKIHVNEPIQGALALSDQSKAKWQTSLATRRLSEAETLAADGRLTSDTSAAINTQLEDSAKGFDATVAALAQVDASSTAIAAAQSDFEATLTAHARILASLAEARPSVKENIAPILAQVEARAEGARASRTIAEGRLSRDSGDVIRAAAIAKKNDAEHSVAQVRGFTSAIQTTLSASTTDAASSSAFEAEQTIEVGNRKLEEGKWGSAFSSFQAAVRTAQETKLDVDAQVRLKDNVDLSHDASPSIDANGSSKDKAGD